MENVIALGKLIGLLFLFCLPLLSILFLKTKRNDLARPVMGTIFLVYLLWVVYLKSVENVIALGKLIGLLFLFCLPLLSILFLKTKRNDLARPVMGTIFLVMYVVGMSVVCQITWNHVNQTRACSKSVLGGKILPVTPIVFVLSIR